MPTVPRGLKIEKETIKWLPKEQVEKIYNFAKPRSIRDYTIILISFNHGLRASEVGIISLSDYRPLEKRIYITRVKGGISNSYLVSDEAYKALKLWIAIRGNHPGPLFVSRKSKMDEDENGMVHGVSRQQLDSIFRKYSKRVGIEKDKQHFHVLRHSIAVYMVDQEVPLVQIKDWLGHRNINSTMVYVDVSNKKRDKTAGMVYKDEEEKREKEKGTGVNWKKDKRK
jgi:type 1 fimbriae regulatory protein FimB